MSPRIRVRKRADFTSPTAEHYALLARQARFEARMAALQPIRTGIARVTSALLFGFAIDVVAQIGRAAGWWHL